VTAVVLDLVAKLHVARTRRRARIGDHRAAAGRVPLLEREACRREPGARARGACRMLAHEPLEMLERRRAIAARLFQLGERQERIVGIGRQRIFDDHSAIVAFSVCRSLGQRAAPEQRVAIRRRAFGSGAQQ
jgi:hypothetical protein